MKRSAERNDLSNPSAQECLSEYCAALGNPVRLEILKLLLNEGTCLAGDIAERFEKAHSTVSEHLRVLKEAGLVSGKVDGPKRCYCANVQAVEHMQQLIAKLSDDKDCCLPVAQEKSE